MDVHPGDRKAKCGGMMEPVGIEVRGKKYEIRYQCFKCGHTNQKKAEENDNPDALIELSKKPFGDKIP